jgi:WD40 repeat protein
MNEMDMILVNCIKDNVKCLSLMDYNGKVLSPLVKDISTEPSSVTFASGLSGYSGLGSSGDYMIAAHNNNTMINISYLNRSKTLLQCRLQESLTSVVVDSMGIYLYGGTKQGNIYMWELGTGRVIKIWQAHWKTVHRLCITQDNHLLITGSEDGTGECFFYSVISFLLTSSYSLPLRYNCTNFAILPPLSIIIICSQNMGHFIIVLLY